MNTAATPSVPARSMDAVAHRLVQVSERRVLPLYARIEFPAELDPSMPPFPVALLSLHGHPIYASMSERMRWQLGLLETVNFFSLNIHGEQALVAELAGRLYRERGVAESVEVSRYLQHFIAEENAHSYMLAEFCQRYYGRVMPEIVLRFEAPVLSRTAGDLLFFSRVFVLETFLDFFNRRAMHDEGLEPTARAVHRSHHFEETRHIAFDRAVIAALASELQSAGAHDELSAIARLVVNYAEYAFARLVNPRIYRELALPDPLGLVREVERSAVRLQLRSAWWRQPSVFLRKVGIPIDTPRDP